MLTPYGRDASAEKLSTWSFDGEQDALQGLIPSTEMFLLGGDARWVRYQSKTDTETVTKFWRMQTDLEAGLHVGPVWLSGVMGTKPAGPTDDPKEHAHLVHRGYTARVDLFSDHIVLRGGLFIPKYGLMLSDHTAFVRSANGLGPDTEQTQAEITYVDDLFEITMAGLVENKLYDREGKSKSGYNVGISLFVGNNSRLNANMLSTKRASETSNTYKTSAGISGVVTLNDMVYSMFEVDRVTNMTQTDLEKQSTEALINYASLNFEVYRGIIPYLRYEFYDNDINKVDTSNSRWGFGTFWYPRPHVQFEARAMRTIVNANHSTATETDGVIHYYF